MPQVNSVALVLTVGIGNSLVWEQVIGGFVWHSMLYYFCYVDCNLTYFNGYLGVRVVSIKKHAKINESLSRKINVQVVYLTFPCAPARKHIKRRAPSTVRAKRRSVMSYGPSPAPVPWRQHRSPKQYASRDSTEETPYPAENKET